VSSQIAPLTGVNEEETPPFDSALGNHRGDVGETACHCRISSGLEPRRMPCLRCGLQVLAAVAGKVGQDTYELLVARILRPGSQSKVNSGQPGHAKPRQCGPSAARISAGPIYGAARFSRRCGRDSVNDAAAPRENEPGEAHGDFGSRQREQICRFFLEAAPNR